MDKWNSFYYLKNVDTQLQALRGHCLGYNTPLNLLLPKEYRELPDNCRTQLLAQQLLFCLADQCPAVEREEFERSWQWLNAILLYLFQKCNKDDQTVGGLMKIVELDYFNRIAMFNDFDNIAPTIWEDFTRPEPLAHLDTVVLTQLDKNGLLESSKALYEQLKNMQKDG